MSHRTPPPQRNYMTELRALYCQLICTPMEPECCNVTCPPLGCPRGPCPGTCIDWRGLPDACCISKMPNPCGSPPKCGTGCSQNRC